MTFNFVKLCIFFSKFILREKSKKNIHFFRHNFLNFYAPHVTTVLRAQCVLIYFVYSGYLGHLIYFELSKAFD